MSACKCAPPLPPPQPSNFAMNGHGPNGTSHTERPGPMPRVFPHIKDLQAKALQKINPYSSITTLIQEAENCTKQADTFADFRRPDLAYVEYLVASEIVLNVIPRHKDAPSVAGDRGRLHRQNKDLQRRIDAQHERFSNIKEIIINQNRRDGVQPTVSSSQAAEYRQRPSTPNAQPPHTAVSYGDNPRLSMPDGFPSQVSISSPPRRTPAYVSKASDGRTSPLMPLGSPRVKPQINPKPESLQDRPSSSGSSHQDPLNERFARLRMNGNSSLSGSRSHHDTYGANRQVKMPSPTDYGGDVSFPLVPTDAPTNRPSGPRTMPDAPLLPPKLPIDTSVAFSLPKQPSPTYSPARNMQTPASINPPRTSARSMNGTGGRSNSIASASSSISSRPPGVNGDTDSYFPNPANGAPRHASTQRNTINMPIEYSITAEKLYDYLKMYHILLIDVRNREDFDQGHIYARSIMCVEPTALRPSMSAEELGDSLVLSPDDEQTMFDRRDAFDLVIYYDERTTTTDFISKNGRNEEEIALKCLYDALYEFNQDKPLQRAPIFLLGGIGAWADLLGRAALATSNTSTIVSSQKSGKNSRPIGRVPMAGTRSTIYVPKQRRRSYNPLHPEEEQKWIQQARKESYAVGQRPAAIDEYEAEEQESVPIYRTTEDFLRRFPEAPSLEQESMISPPTRSAPPVPPNYAPPSIPSEPSRPAPAVARVNYSGVHDRSASQTVTLGRSTNLPNYIPPSQRLQNVRLPYTGLINFGVTCYMNATIQCLSGTIPLTSLYRNGTYEKYIQEGNWKGTKGAMSNFYAALIQNIWKGDVKLCRPSSLRKFCAVKKDQWGEDQQQDAKEFLEFLLEFLHEDLNVNWSRPPTKVLSDAEEAQREMFPKPYAAIIEWKRYTNRESSLVQDLFAGQHASQLRCKTCGKTSTTYETFFDISVEIPRHGTASIYNCLDSYCAEERLTEGDEWRCPHCKKTREATKKITITRAPRYLVVHFKRFSAGFQERASKVRSLIDFPLDGLDMSKYMLPPVTEADKAWVQKRFSREHLESEMKLDQSMTGPYIYNAYAVMRHIGNNISSGHYISMVKDPGRGVWRQYNDDRVDDFDPKQYRLQTPEAYIVFYERVPNPSYEGNG
ncbi:cysteine proteinase [Patellaria atrata CBS 101060]|uniref:Cysteine proteinase n=1 Tax=Patellaria atrata CBS 101060 TaxID=1346257 RepID=A0A9P4VRD8_9PEZI|nr:cysteine proteinase [Patellaria atrata CBS 101060]